MLWVLDLLVFLFWMHAVACARYVWLRGLFGVGCLCGAVGFKRDFVVCGLLVLVWVFAFELVGFGLAGCIVCGWLRELWLCCWV